HRYVLSMAHGMASLTACCPPGGCQGQGCHAGTSGWCPPPSPAPPSCPDAPRWCLTGFQEPLLPLPQGQQRSMSPHYRLSTASKTHLLSREPRRPCLRVSRRAMVRGLMRWGTSTGTMQADAGGRCPSGGPLDSVCVRACDRCRRAHRTSRNEEKAREASEGTHSSSTPRARSNHPGVGAAFVPWTSRHRHAARSQVVVLTYDAHVTRNVTLAMRVTDLAVQPAERRRKCPMWGEGARDPGLKGVKARGGRRACARG